VSQAPIRNAGQPEPVTLLFDVRSPWCYQTSRWLRRLAELGQVTPSWGVFSLEVVNLHGDEDPAGYDAEYGPALRVAATSTPRSARACGRRRRTVPRRCPACPR
jgi:predicted DsbA family dithiol-disulfide isomerase